ncbi:MAG: tetratricopeptide repeat protein [Verrucomicrobiota bacterium]|nr:tetratricopeptide repeat protein [Verrucomicrobiota bacterium]
MRRTLSLFVLFTGFLMTVSTVQAAPWWWPFGGDDEWANVPRAEQDAAAVSHMESAAASQRRGSRGNALKEYKVVYKKYPGSRYAPEALYQTGLIRMEQKKWRKGFEAFQQLLNKYPDFPQFDDVIAQQFTIATSLAEGINVRYLGFIPFRNFERANEYYEKLILNAPYSDYAPLALMNVANIHRYKREQPEAIDALDRLINNYPQSLLAPDAYMNLADTFASLVDGPLYDQGATREAIGYYQDFLILYPTSPLVKRGEEGLTTMQEVHADSKFVLGNYYYKHRDYLPGAKVFLNETITTAPNSQAAAKARDLLAKIAAIEASRPPPPPVDLEPAPAKKSWWSRFWFWDSETDDTDAAPAAPPPLEDGIDPVLQTTTPPPVVEETHERSFWDRLKFWKSSEPETTVTEPEPAVAPEPAVVAPTDSEPAKPRRSFWDRMKFWKSSKSSE